jgi:TolB protein
MDADGANRRNITPTPGFAPDLSPDGRRIVFNIGLGTGGLAIVDSDGANLRTLVPTISVYTPPSWSPDGRRILYSDGHTLRTINPDGIGDRVIFTPTKTPYNDGLSLFGASWAPDGRRVVATSLGASSADGLWILDLDAQTATHVYTGSAHEVAWSPLGDRIAFSGRPNPAIFTVRPDGTDLQQLTGLAGQIDRRYSATDPAWSTDGTRIAFTLNSSTDSTETNRTIPVNEIWDIGVDGSGLRNLTHDAGQDRQPTF